MTRTARVVLQDHPHHIIQRGHNKLPVFFSRRDHQYYLDNLRALKQELGCKVYAFCLMTNHVHLIVDPGGSVANLAMLMKRISGRQSRYVNKLQDRTGTLWESRYKSTVICSEEYLLACCRYIELNPVRAAMAAKPEEYEWSSYRHRVGLESVAWLDEDLVYQELGVNAEERTINYANWVKESIPDGEWRFLRTAIQRGQLTGSSRFVDEVAHTIGRRIEPRGPGRPKAAPTAEK